MNYMNFYNILLLLFSFAVSVQPLQYFVALKQQNLPELEKAVLEVSNPASPNYGNYKTTEEILNMIAPRKSLKVSNWLSQINASVLADYGDALHIDVSDEIYRFPNDEVILVERVNHNASFENYRFGNFNKKHISNLVDDNYAGREVLEKLYKFSNVSISNASIGIIEFSGSEGFNLQDLSKIQIANAQKVNPIQHIIGANTGEDGESQLDVSIASAVADNVEMWFWQTDSWLYSFAVDFFNSTNTPDVISMSYGWSETDQCAIATCTENVTSKIYVERVNVEFQKLALQGKTILVSSGDAGAPGRTNENCMNTDDYNPINPVFPGSSPWITSIGATVILNKLDVKDSFVTPLCKNHGCFTGNTEASINYNLTGWTAGGGFGLYGCENTPEWQQKKVSEYLSKALLPNNTFNSKGRAYPDISAIGHACPLYMDGELTGEDGTSCSAPLIAGLVAIINDHQTARGKPKVGFVNPLLYAMADIGFNDIPRGSNTCTEYQCCSKDFGFQAVKGYDPVSGLGTPKMDAILAYLDKNIN